MKTKFCIRKYHLTCRRKLAEGTLRIVFLTDMHNCVGGEEGSEVMRLVQKCNPDLILVGGDVLVGKAGAETKTAAEFIARLSKRYPVWYANGNHEQRIQHHPEIYGTMGEEYEAKIGKTKAERLVNCFVSLNVGGIPLKIYGFDPKREFYQKGFRKKGMEEALQSAFGIPDRECYTVLLSHTPRYAKEYLRWGADLTLSGHYHGGVMLLGKKTGLITPDFRMFSRLCCGIRSRRESHMIVSAGLGEHTVPVRIHNPGEVTLIQVDF